MITRQLVKSPAATEERAVEAGADPYLADRYFTDDVNLYRLSRWLSRPGLPPLAELEDCRSLHVILLERDELSALSLRAVAHAGGTG